MLSYTKGSAKGGLDSTRGRVNEPSRCLKDDSMERIHPTKIFQLVIEFDSFLSLPSMKVVGLISGGKDSIHNLLHCIALGHEVVALANLRPGAYSKHSTSSVPN